MARLTANWPEPRAGVTWPERTRCPFDKVQRAWVDFLGRIPWEYFVTLTFDPKRIHPVGQERASQEVFSWCCHLGRLYRRPVAWVYVTERGRTGLWHAHALVIGLENNTLDTAKQVWTERNGSPDVQRVWNGFGATLYCTKSVPQGAEVVLSDTLVRYREQLSPEVKVHLGLSSAQEGLPAPVEASPLTLRRKPSRMAGPRSEVWDRQGEILIAPGSQRPASVVQVTQRVIHPALIEWVLTSSEG